MFLVETFSLLPDISAETFFFIPVDYQEDVAFAVQGGLEMLSSTLLLTFVLEICSIPTVKAILKQPGGKSLYLSAIFMNFFNHLCLGVPLWTAVHLFMTTMGLFNPNDVIENYCSSALRILGVLFIHSLCYYHVHKLFHSNRAWYKHHAYHHRFTNHVSPIAAGAVTPVEYLMGYILPFVPSVFAMGTILPEMKIAIYIIADLNILFHFPPLEEPCERLWQAFASTALHMEHHRKQNINLAAPTLNWDWINEQLGNSCVKFQ